MLIRKIFLLQIIILLLLSGTRMLYIYLFAVDGFYKGYIADLISSLFFAVRLDISVLGYVSVLPLLLSILMLFFTNKTFFNKIKILLIWYFTMMYIIVFMIIFLDIAFFSYFGEHLNIMLFGFFDDDTLALVNIARENYNLPAIIIMIFIVIYMLFKLVKSVFTSRDDYKILSLGLTPLIGISILLVIVNFLAIRGTFGIFPIHKMVPDISTNIFINKLANNPVFSFKYAINQYYINKLDKYDLIKTSGYTGNIKQAFSDLSGIDIIDKNDLLLNITYKTKKRNEIEKQPPHVVVIMVESFGMPILNYQTSSFNIMGHLKKHFDEDLLFTNFVSASNGTISSLEPLLLNLTARPLSTSYGQSKYLGVEFSQSAARVYQLKGYETNFVYGGDLSWRNVGSFFKRQGFDNVEGKMNILEGLNLNNNNSTVHDWGVFDEYAYSYIIKKLKNATTPQFIFLLTTNNHPPYRIQPNYKANSLIWSQKLNNSVVGDKKLITKRLYDYQYALDQAGIFMDSIKLSPLSQNTVVVITADNNTIEGNMHYDNYLDTTKKIPFYLYAPKYILPKTIDSNIPASHKDIFPTLYNLTLSEANYTSVGTDLLNQKILHCGFNDAGIIISRDGAFKWNKAGSTEQKKCNKNYNSTLAVTEYLIKSQLNK